MKNRKGQALIVVVIIMAVVMAVFANSLTTGIRSHSLTETEVYQREQALYLAEIGVNRMIFNINNGATYNDGDSISGTVPGIGSYKSTYHTPDDSGYGDGGVYIESIGTVGEFSRRIFVSVQEGGSDEAFKYCLYTSQGGRDGVNDDCDDCFRNNIHGVNYWYNTQPDSSMPHPDMTQYSTHWESGYYFTESSAIYRPFESNDNNKVVYIEARGSPPTTLTVDFQNYSSIKLSLATNATNVIIKNMKGSFQWSPADEFEGYTFPIITHSGTGEIEFDFNDFWNNWNETLKLRGFIYTKGSVDMKYLHIYIWLFGLWLDSYGEIDGEVMEVNPANKLGGPRGDTHIKYITTDYYTTPPPHFIVPGGKAKVLPGSFREEY